MNKIKEEERMIYVKGDWSPCYPKHQARLRFCFIHFTKTDFWDDNYMIKIVIAGNDDYGFELERHYNTLEEGERAYKRAYNIYKTIPHNRDCEWFIKHGFIRM